MAVPLGELKRDRHGVVTCRTVVRPVFRASWATAHGLDQ